MLYKTILLELLEQHPNYLDQLRRTRQIMPWLVETAFELQARHAEWNRVFFKQNPGSIPGRFSSEALEIAIREVSFTFPPESPGEELGDFPIEEAIRWIHRPLHGG